MDERVDLEERFSPETGATSAISSGGPGRPVSSGITHALAWVVILIGGTIWIGLNSAPTPPAGTPQRIEADDATMLFGKLMLGLRQVVTDLGAPFQNRDVLVQIDGNIDQTTASGRLASAALRATFGSSERALEDLHAFDEIVAETADGDITSGGAIEPFTEEADGADAASVADAAEQAARHAAESAANERLAETVRTLVLAIDRHASDATNAEGTASIGPAPIDADARVLLLERLGPIGTGLLAAFDEPEAEAEIQSYTTAFLGIAVFLTIAAVGGLIGLVMLVLLATLLVRRLARAEPGGLGAPSNTGSVYAETFAIWLLLFLGLQAVGGVIQASMLPPEGLDGVPVPMDGPGGLAFSLVIFFTSLVALIWPVLRGVPWAQVRSDVGLRLGNPFVEIPAGALIWCAALPLLVGGLIVFMILQSLVTAAFGPIEGPSHPIQGLVGQGGVANIILIFLIAVVGAPIVEEIMFRGVFYRYLRDASRWLGAVVSGLSAMFVSSFIFAAIHPQGLLFVPVLGALATAFCFAREWRGSLLAAMTAHAINNGLVLSLSLVMFA